MNVSSRSSAAGRRLLLLSLPPRLSFALGAAGDLHRAGDT